MSEKLFINDQLFVWLSLDKNNLKNNSCEGGVFTIELPSKLYVKFFFTYME